jgi:hypothetical protein
MGLVRRPLLLLRWSHSREKLTTIRMTARPWQENPRVRYDEKAMLKSGANVVTTER